MLLARQGHDVTVFERDATPLPESPEASWESWRDDLKRGVEWLRSRANGCHVLWGIRLGAVMAADLAAQDSGIGRLLLWQPVTSGKNYFTQFLRIRIAAEMQTATVSRRPMAQEAVRSGRGSPRYRVIGSGLIWRARWIRCGFRMLAALSSLRLSWFDVSAGG
jgi:hypothetical protein